VNVRRPITVLAALAVVIVAGFGLGWGAHNGVKSATQLSSHEAVVQGALDDDYYACLTTQARSLIRRGEAVAVNEANLQSWVIVTKVLGSWAVLDNRAVVGRSVPTVALITRPGPGSCLGSVVTTSVVTRKGHIRVRRGSGASLLGHQVPPAPNL
jgi:hypothetical protein